MEFDWLVFDADDWLAVIRSFDWLLLYFCMDRAFYKCQTYLLMSDSALRGFANITNSNNPKTLDVSG